MALHTSGPMHFSQIQNEFGGSGELRLTQYYRAGGRVPNVQRNYSISTGGRIAFSMFYGASKELSPEQLAIAAGEGANAFSRSVHSGVDQPMPNSYWNGSFWQRNNAGPYYVDWWFNNTSWAPTDGGSTIVFAGGGRGPSHVNISSILKADGTYAPYRIAHHASWIGAGVPWSTGASVTSYHCDCDRREIVRVSTSWTTYSGGNRDTTMGCFILPSQMSVVNSRRYLGPQWTGVEAGDILVMCGSGIQDDDFNPSLQTHHSVIVGGTWYNYHYAGAVFGSSPRGWSFASPALSWPMAPVTIMLRLRRLVAGQGAQQLDGLGAVEYRGTIVSYVVSGSTHITINDAPVWGIADGSGLNGGEEIFISNLAISGVNTHALTLYEVGPGIVGICSNGTALHTPSMTTLSIPYSMSARLSTVSGRAQDISVSGTVTYSQNIDNGGDGGA